MPTETGRQVPERRRAVSRPLLPAAIRPAAIALLAVCVAVTALLGLWFMHQARAGWPDSAIDGRLRAALGGQRAVLGRLGDLGDPLQVAGMAVALILGCLAARRWRGALLVAVAVPAAGAVTEYLLKPLFDRTLQGNLEFPSGHATGVFALAAVCAVLLASPPRLRLPVALRVILALIAFLAAAAVAVAIVALGYHYFTDTVAGAAVGTAVALATALILDRLLRRVRPRSSSAAGRPAASQPPELAAEPGPGQLSGQARPSRCGGAGRRQFVLHAWYSPSGR